MKEIVDWLGNIIVACIICGSLLLGVAVVAGTISYHSYLDQTRACKKCRCGGSER